MTLRRIKKRVTFANVAAVVAVSLALGNGVVFAGGGTTSAGKIVGYAKVRADGIVVTAKSLNVESSNVTLESDSAYCFRNLPFKFKGAQVTLDYRDIGEFEGLAQFVLGNPYGDCEGAQVQAEVATSDGVDWRPIGFFVVFYK